MLTLRTVWRPRHASNEIIPSTARRTELYRRPFIAGLVLTFSLLGSTSVSAQRDDERARAVFRIAEAHHATGEYEDAARRFSEAYVLSGRPSLLYNIYLTYRDAQLDEDARDALAEYLRLVSDDPRKLELQARLERLEDAHGKARRFDAKKASRRKPIAATSSEPAQATESKHTEANPRGTELEDTKAEEPKEAASEAEVASVGPSDAKLDAPIAEGASARSGDAPKKVPVAAIVVLGTGGALVVGGTVTGIFALRAYNRLADACPNKSCDPADGSLIAMGNRGRTLALATDILLGAGLATAAIGTVLLLVSRPRSAVEQEPERASAPKATFGCGPTGCGVSLRGRF